MKTEYIVRLAEKENEYPSGPFLDEDKIPRGVKQRISFAIKHGQTRGKVSYPEGFFLWCTKVSPSEIFEQLKVACLPILEAYKNDLEWIDREIIEGNPSTPFLHWTRNTGTQLILLVPASEYAPKGVLTPYLFGRADREHVLEGIASNTVFFCDDIRHYDHKLVHYFDGSTLKKVDKAKAKQVADDYKRKIKRTWEHAEEQEYHAREVALGNR